LDDAPEDLEDEDPERSEEAGRPDPDEPPERGAP
jgi:hypothetical protein